MRLRSIFTSTLCVTVLWLDHAAAQSKQCLEMDCFYSRQVRNFEVIDRDTMVIYVGRERCAYKIKVDNLYCDLTYLPEVEFFDRRQRDIGDRLRGDDQRDAFGRRSQLGSFNERVCTYSNSLALETFEFADTAADAPLGQAACEVREIAPITDDELLEVYVSEGIVPPPPPIGNGDLSRADDASEPSRNNAASEAGEGGSDSD